MTDIIQEQYRRRGAKAVEFRKMVLAREAKAAEELGGPVNRTSEFVNKGADVIFTWRRVG